MNIISSVHRFLERLEKIDFLALFCLRLYLFHIFWYEGTGYIENINEFSDLLKDLGFLIPEILAWLVIIIETGGAILLLGGLLVRWVSIPLLITILVAIFTVHIDNGWAHENNGIEFPVIYILMILTLLFCGGGKYLSLDYWVKSNRR